MAASTSLLAQVSDMSQTALVSIVMLITERSSISNTEVEALFPVRLIKYGLKDARD